MVLVYHQDQAIQFKLVTADAGANQLEVFLASQVSSAAVDHADVVQAADALAVQAVQELLHSLTLLAVAAVAAVTVQISVGLITPDILDVMVAVVQLTHTIVQHTEQVAAVELELMVKVPMDHADVQTMDMQTDQAAVADQVEPVVILESHGQMVKVTDITVVETTAAVAVDLDLHTVADTAAVALFVLFGQEIHVVSHLTALVTHNFITKRRIFNALYET